MVIFSTKWKFRGNICVNAMSVLIELGSQQNKPILYRTETQPNPYWAIIPGKGSSFSPPMRNSPEYGGWTEINNSRSGFNTDR